METGKEMIRFGMALIAVLIAITAVVSALSIPPVVTIAATPNPADVNSTITAIAVDLSGSGIKYAEIFENNVSVKKCAAATCIYVDSHTAPQTRSFYAVGVDNTGRMTTSSTISVNFQNIAPVLNSIGNFVIDENELLQFTINASDANGDALTYSASGLPAGAVFNAGTRTFSWIPDFTQSGVYNVNFSVTDGTAFDSEVVQITVNDIVIPGDTEAPRYYNPEANPESPVVYVPGAEYEFSVAWIDNAGVANVWIEFNGVNYTLTSIGSVYNFEIDDLAAGTYDYRWYAEDANGNLNQTGLFSYVINRAIPALAIQMLPGAVVGNGTNTTVTGTGCPSQLTGLLYRDGVAVSNPDTAALAVGNYSYVFNATGNANYTDASASGILSVVQGSVPGDGDGDDDDEDDDIEIIEIDDDDLNSGYTLWMNEGDKVKFVFCGTPYFMKLSEVDADDEEATFSITPGAIRFTLDEDSSTEIDLDGDNVKDIRVKVEDIGTSRAKVHIKRISTICAGTRTFSTGSGSMIYDSSSKATESADDESWYNRLGVLLWMIVIFILLLIIFAFVLKRARG